MSGNNAFYFTTTDASGFYPTALWVSDGTAGGTKLVESFPAGSIVQPLEQLFGGYAFGAFLFAVSTNNSTDLDLTQGTQISTRMVLNASFGPLPPNTLTNNIAFLSPTEVVGGFSYNGGDANGAVVVGMVDLLNPNPTALTTIEPQSPLASETVGDFTALDGVAFFVDSNADGVARLYRTDGTPANTGTIVAAPDIGNLVLQTNTASVTQVFLSESTTAAPATSHGELLTITAAASAPSLLYDFGAGTAVLSITNAANILFIVTQVAGGAFSLWSSNGTATPPILVAGLGSTAPAQILVDGDGSPRIFFQLGNQLLIATATGLTTLGSFAAIGTMFAAAGTLYFGASTGAGGMQLWSSDGSQAGTAQIATINATGDADPSGFSELNGTLYFSATDGVHGAELWSWNGSAASLVTDLDPGAAGSNPADITPGYVPPASGTATGLVTFRLGISDDAGTYGISDGTLGGTAVSYGAPAGVVTFLSATQVSHGSADTTITLPSAYSDGPISYTSAGVFSIALQTDPTTYTQTRILQFTGNNATALVTVGSYTATITTGYVDLTDRVADGATEFYLVERGDYNDLNFVTQLWSSDGTVAGTTMIANLGTVFDLGYDAYPSSSNAVAGAAGWGALLADDTTNAVSLFTSTGTTGNANDVTPASIGLATATIDNTGNFSLALAGTKYFFSVTNATNIEAIATDGTAGNTAVLTSETPTSSTQVYGDFTTAGNLVYFDDGVGGALYVSGGTAATTRQLLSAGAYLAPYGSDETQVDTASTASMTVAGTTYFYFTALQSGQIGLYVTNGTTVQQVTVDIGGVAQSLAQNAYITASGSSIWFVAGSGAGTTTLWTTTPGATTAAPVIDPTLFPTGSALTSIYGPPQGVIDLRAAVPLANAPDTFFLTPGTDTVTGGAGDTAIYGGPSDLNPGDSIDGGAGINDLYLSGSGTFDLSLPATLANVTQVLASGTNDLIKLRAGTTLTLQLTASGAGNAGDTIIGAANADTIAGSGNDTITVGSNSETIFDVGRAIITAATENAFLSQATTVEVAGGGTVTLDSASGTGHGLGSISALTLDAPTNLSLAYTGYGLATALFVQGSPGADTITLASPYAETSSYYLQGDGGDDTYILAPDSRVVATFYDTAANLNGTTIDAFDFAPYDDGGVIIGDTIDVTDFLFSSTETVQYSAGTLTIRNAAGTAQTSLAIQGAPEAGGFVLSSDGEYGTDVTFVAQLFTLTTGPDTVTGTTDNQIDATDATLSSGDRINGGAPAIGDSTLELRGPGTFDLSRPTLITGLSTIDGDTTGAAIGGSTAVSQTIRLRDGLDTSIMLGAGQDVVYGAVNAAAITSAPENLATTGDDIFVGDARESISLSGYIHDVIHVTAATALAPVSDNQEGGYHPNGTEEVDGGGLVALGEANVGTVELAAPTHLITASYSPNLIVAATGNDTIDVTNAGAFFGGGIVTIQPTGGDTIIAPINAGLLVASTQAALNFTTIEGVNFLPTLAVGDGQLTPTTIDITDLAYASGVVTTQFTSGTLTVHNGTALVDSFILPLPGPGAFVPAADSAGTGTALTFTATGTATPLTATLTADQTSFVGSPSNDTLTIPAGVLAATQTLDGQGGDNALALASAATFDLTLPASLQNFTVLQPAGNDTVTLRPGLPLQIAGNTGTNTIIGANAPDPILLENGEQNDTVIVNNPSATVIDAGYGETTIELSAASFGATVIGARTNTDTLDVSGSGGMVMGAHIRDIAAVNLTESGAILFANAIPNLAITLSGDAHAAGGARDIVIAGSGNDVIADDSTGGNILAAGAGNDVISIGSFTALPVDDTIYGFDVSGADTLEFPQIVSSTVLYSAGTLTVGDSGSRQVSIALNGSYDGTFVSIYNGNFGGAAVTFTGTITGATPAPCFAAGTRLLTPTGEQAVETLRVNDRVITLRGQRATRIVWLGHRHVDLRRHPNPAGVQPIRVRAHAFGPGAPHTDLLLSPDHAIFIDGALVPVRLLVNATTITRQDMPHITYWHVELATHDVVLAEGLPCETYLDTANRHAFANAGAALQLHPDFTRPAREARLCAPLVMAGEPLTAIRASLGDVAAKQDWGAAPDPAKGNAFGNHFFK